MNNKECCYNKKNNNDKLSSKSKCHKQEIPLTDEYKSNYEDGKSATCNNWSSVPQNYDIKESCEKHEKTATNNQWCSCSKY